MAALGRRVAGGCLPSKVNSDNAVNSGTAREAIVNPKLYAGPGRGRVPSSTSMQAAVSAATMRVVRRSGVDPKPATRSVTRDAAGVRTKSGPLARAWKSPGLQTSLAILPARSRVRIAFVGDAGTTEASWPSRDESALS